MRIWRSSAEDDGSIHSLGNGLLCAYGRGPDLIQVFGPPYSAPSLFRLLLRADDDCEVQSEREPGAAIWRHHVLVDGRELGEMLDFVDAELPCLVRRLRLSTPLRFRMEMAPCVQLVQLTDRFAGCGASGGCLLSAPAGTYLYHTYPVPTPVYHQVAWRGPVSCVKNADASLEFVCGPGEVDFLFVGGTDYPNVITQTETALQTHYSLMLERTRQLWCVFSESRHDFGAQLSANVPQRERILEAIDSVAVLIKAQQSREGGVLAGYNYHLAYVRDQYGVARGLLALGLTDAARFILDFYWGVWQRYGVIHNAQAAGVDGVFHVHENDDVEITGYLIRQAFDLLEKTSDKVYLDSILPMLEWAWESEKQHLVNGMLPFNGDETYIAGGILPRHTLNDGSAEATLLFIDGGEKLLDWIEQNRAWSADKIRENRAVLSLAKSRYRANFWNGRLVTNHPNRASAAQLPRFRHGICERCQAELRRRGIQWTERNSNGRYLCPECLEREIFPAAASMRYVLQSVSLTPFYFQSDLFAASELAPVVDEIVTAYVATGQLPSLQVGSPTAENRSVGYDYGFLLYALTSLRHPMAGLFCGKTLDLLDSTGAWVEYYSGTKPTGTRCRPWESAINLEAILRWAEQSGEPIALRGGHNDQSKNP